MPQTIFISYSWANSNIADHIDSAFAPTGINIKRDVREIPYKGSIKEYMKEVRSTDFVLLIISDDFLKSPNAMFEVLELIKDENFKEKILPIIVAGAKIYKPEEQLEYIQYWDEKYKDLELKLKSVKVTDSIELYKDLKHYENIRTSIAEFLTIISDSKNSSFSELVSDRFKQIFDYLGVSDKVLVDEIIALDEFKTEEELDIEMDRLELKYPKNSKVYFVKGHYAYAKNHIEKSIHFYKKSIEFDPLFGAAYYNLGCNYETYKEDFAEAKKLYEKAVEYEPRNARAYANLAGLYSTRFANPDKAKELLEIALQIDPFYAVAHYDLALIYHRDLINYELAIYHYEFAIRIKKDFIDAKHNYGMLLWKEFKRFSDAKREFQEILEIDPVSKNTLNQLANLYEIEYKHYKSAKLYYDRFIQIEPNFAYEYYDYALFLLSHFSSTEKELASKYYNIACSMDESYKSEQMELLLKP